MEYRIAIIGSRDFNNFDFLDKKVKELMPKQDYQFIIVSGGAKGTDTLAERFAEKYNYYTEIYRAKWHVHGKCAGYLRNHDIVRNADMVIAFWNGMSKGTKHTINIARHDENRVVHVIRVDNIDEGNNDGI